MLVPPDDLTNGAVVNAMETGWPFGVKQLDYLPVGAGSHHWLAIGDNEDKLFVKVDDLRSRGGSEDEQFVRLSRSYTTAWLLENACDLGFVVGPIRDQDNRAIRRINSRYAVTVFPVVDGKAGAFDDEWSEPDRSEVVRILSRLHQSTAHVRDTAGVDDLAIDCREQLDAMLVADAAGSGGPFAGACTAKLSPTPATPRNTLGGRRHVGHSKST